MQLANIDNDAKHDTRWHWRNHLRVGRVLVQLARPGAVAVADQAVVSLANFAIGAVLARGLPQEQFGLYALGMTLVVLALDLQTTVTSTPYMVFSPHLPPESRATYLGSTSVHQLTLGVLSAAALMSAGTVLSRSQSGVPLSTALLALGLVILFVLFRDFARHIHFAHLEPRSALVLDSVVSGLQVLAVGFLVWTNQLTVPRTFLAIGIAAAGPVAAWAVTNRHNLRVSWPSIIQDLRINWGFGKWPLMSGALWSLSLYLYPWLLAAMFGTGKTAIWAVGVGTVAIANPLLLGYQNHLGPRIATSYAREGVTGLRRVVADESVRFAIIVSPVVILLLVLGGAVAVVVYGGQYAHNGLLVGVLAVNLVVSAVAYPYSRGLFALNRADVDFRVNLVALGVLFLIGVWLVRAWGPIGAACGLLCSNLASSGLRARSFWQLTDGPAA